MEVVFHGRVKGEGLVAARRHALLLGDKNTYLPHAPLLGDKNTCYRCGPTGLPWRNWCWGTFLQRSNILPPSPQNSGVLLCLRI